MTTEEQNGLGNGATAADVGSGYALLRLSYGAQVPNAAGYASAFIMIVVMPVMLTSLIPAYGVAAAIIWQPAAFFLCMLFFISKGMTFSRDTRPRWSWLVQFSCGVLLGIFSVYLMIKLGVCHIPDDFRIWPALTNDTRDTIWDSFCFASIFVVFVTGYGVGLVFWIGSYKFGTGSKLMPLSRFGDRNISGSSLLHFLLLLFLTIGTLQGASVEVGDSSTLRGVLGVAILLKYLIFYCFHMLTGHFLVSDRGLRYG